MDGFRGTSDDGNFDRDSLSDEQLSNDSLLNEKDLETYQEHFPIRRKGSYTIEMSPAMSRSIKERKSRLPNSSKIDNNSQITYTSDKSDLDVKIRYNGSQKNMMTQSMYERPWITSKKNNSMINKQREEKLRLAKEEQIKKQLQKVNELNETQKQAEIARKRKEEEVHRKLEEKRLKALERQRIVEERKQRLLLAEEARKSRILHKMTNQDEKHVVTQASNSIMTMSCYGALGSTKRRPGNKEVLKDRFISKRPLSSTGKVIGFGSSSPRIICENPMKSTTKHPPKVSDYLMERSIILSRPVSTRMPDRMTTSVMVPHQPVLLHSPVNRQDSLKEKRNSTTVSSTIDEQIKKKTPKKSKPKSIKEDCSDGNNITLNRTNSRKTNSAQTHNTMTKSVRERPSSAKPIPHSTNITDRGLVQSKSSTFPKAKAIRQSNKPKIDLHVDSDSIEDDGTTMTETRSITSSSLLPTKNEINRMNLSSADSLESESVKQITNDCVDGNIENPSQKSNASGRALPTKDLTEADYKTRLMENRRLMREKREKEREQLMKAERERRHAEEATAREIMELEKNKLIKQEEKTLTTSNDDAVEEPSKPLEMKEAQDDEAEHRNSITIEIDQADPDLEYNKAVEEKERLARKKRLESIMSRLKKTNEESSSEGGGISPRRAMSPEPAEIDTEVPVANSNPMFRSSLLQSMLNKGKLSGISKNVQATNKDTDETKTSDETHIINNQPIGTLTLTSLRESMEDSESQNNNLNSKSSAAVLSSGVDGNSLSDANSDFVIDQEHQSESSLVNEDHGNCDGPEEVGKPIHEEKIINGVPNANSDNNYSSTSSIETEEDEVIKNSFNQDHLYNSHIIRPLAQEGCVFQS